MSAVPNTVPFSHYASIDATIEEMQRLNDIINRQEELLRNAQHHNGALMAVLADVAIELTANRNGWQQGMIERIGRALK